MSDNKQRKAQPRPPRRFVIRLSRNLILYYKKPRRHEEQRQYERCCHFYDFFQHLIQKAYDKPRFAVEFAALVVVGFYTVFAGIQSCEMVSATQATQQSADSEVNATRAWLVLGKIGTIVEGVGNHEPDNIIPAGTINYENAGKTPATDVVSYLEIKALPWGPNKQPTFKSCPKHVARRDPVVAAGDPSQIPIVPYKLTDAERQSLHNGDDALYIHGCIRYQDVLTPNRSRLTEFGGFTNCVNAGSKEHPGKAIPLKCWWDISTLKIQ